MPRDTARRADVGQGQARAHETALHSRHPDSAPEQQPPGRSDEVVVATDGLDVATDRVCATGVAGRVPTPVG
jgi:hypothetical protein